uniref:Uncharacterized protein n=1 Tax=Glossina austeni TaxID=7395 RepID=A0A1A9VGP5_GLOAU
MAFEVVLVVPPVLKLFLTVAFDLAMVSKFVLYQMSTVKLNLKIMTDVVLVLQMMPTIPIDVVVTVVFDVLLILNNFATEGVTTVAVLIPKLLLTTMGGAAVVLGMIVYLMLIPNLMLMVMTEMFLFLKVIAMTMIEVVQPREMVGIVSFEVLIILEVAVTEEGFAFLALMLFQIVAFDMAVATNWQKLALYQILVLSLVLPLMTNVVLILQMVPTGLIDVVVNVIVILIRLIEVLTMGLIAVLDVLWTLVCDGKVWSDPGPNGAD